ncbi:NUDIX hydrolase [Halobaculum gomorrense]|uniref:ADP-ribose pyrophosphatase n=1 Tax=Halobaculum gomorrense TaxID=43928 RepID=A0A1M5M6E5_9EURY|nr:NUDIX hydrolase [Halobaculum gomorrense]SHG72822.1 ADP-ribose pyrophosphatase [Halobaculum gomorrense]
MTDDSDAGRGGAAGGDGARDDLAWETFGGDTDYSCPGFDVRRDDVRLPDGTETDFHYVDEPPAVVILPFTPDGDVVLVEEWRQAVGRVNRGLPAGTVEDDDADLAAAARRELREETGHEAASVERLLTVEPANGFANSVHHYFLARECTQAAEADLDLDFNESIRPVTTDYEGFRDAVFAGEVRDGRAVIGVSAYENGDG